MDGTQWYSATLRAIIVVCIFFYLLFSIYALRTYLADFFFKHVYPRIPRSLRGSSRIARFEAILLLLFLAGNVLSIAIGTKNTSVMKRMGTMSIINLVPLALGSHMNFIASWWRIRPQSYERMHRWVGKVAILEGLIHSVMAAVSKLPRSHNRPAVIAAAVLATIFLTSNALIRRNLYEVFLKLHLISAGALVVAVWLHTKPSKVLEVPKIYPFTATVLWLLTRLLRLANLLYRSFRYHNHSHGTVMRLQDAFHICIKLARPWEEPRAGQWVYVTFPWLRPSAIFQSHPFVVAWWYKSGDAGDEMPDGARPDTIVLIGQPKSGFTRDIFAAGREAELREMTKNTGTQELNGCVCTTIDEPEKMRAIIEGPYGEELDFSSYGTVVLIATGVGIAHQTAYTRRLLEEHHKWNTKTQRVALFWELENERHTRWVNHWMRDLIKMDSRFILEIRIFVLGHYLDIQTKPGSSGRAGTHGSIRVTYKRLEVRDIMSEEIEGRKGRMLVSTCVHEKMAEQIREVVADNLDKDIRLEELSFNPSTPKDRPTPKGMPPPPPRSLLRRVGSFLYQLL